MSTHDPRHDGLLRQVTLGELERDAASVRDLESCPTCRHTLDELDHMKTLFTAEGHALDREVEELAQAASDEAPDDVEERILTGFRSQVAATAFDGPPAGQEAALRRWAPIVLVAAAALLVLTRPWNWSDDPPPDRSGISLGEDGASIVLSTEATLKGSFEWTCELEGAANYGITVYDASFRTLAREHTRSTSWTPDPSLAATWPETIHWEITAFDASGTELGSASGSASFSSP